MSTNDERATALAQLTDERVESNRAAAERQAAEERQEQDTEELKARLLARSETIIAGRARVIDRFVEALNTVLVSGNELEAYKDEYTKVRQQASNLGVLVQPLGEELGQILRYKHDDLFRKAYSVFQGIGRV